MFTFLSPFNRDGNPGDDGLPYGMCMGAGTQRHGVELNGDGRGRGWLGMAGGYG